MVRPILQLKTLKQKWSLSRASPAPNHPLQTSCSLNTFAFLVLLQVLCCQPHISLGPHKRYNRGSYCQWGGTLRLYCPTCSCSPHLPAWLTQWQLPWCTRHQLRWPSSNPQNHGSCRSCGPSRGPWWQPRQWHSQSGPAQGESSGQEDSSPYSLFLSFLSWASHSPLVPQSTQTGLVMKACAFNCHATSVCKYGTDKWVDKQIDRRPPWNPFHRLEINSQNSPTKPEGISIEGSNFLTKTSRHALVS